MLASRLCLLGSALLLAAGCASALLTPGETFPNIQAGLSVATNISTYTTSSQYVTVRASPCVCPLCHCPLVLLTSLARWEGLEGPPRRHTAAAAQHMPQRV
jgi:hypothetical protein